MENTTLKIIKADDNGTRLDVIHTDNDTGQCCSGPIYPVGFTENPNDIIDIEAEIEQKYPGLLLDTHVVKDDESKARAANSLYGWRYVELTAREWIAHLCAGHIIQPSAFRPASNGTYTHAKEYWDWTYFVCADADHIRGVEFLENGMDKNPNGVEHFTTHAGLQQFPSLRFKVYAMTESVSSMHKAPPHRRYRLIFLLDEPITSEAHYHQVLLGLSAEFPIIPPVDRSPAQPVFGNARQGHNHAAILGNFLRLSDYPYQEPEPEQTNRQNDSKATDDDLYRLLNENNIACEQRTRGGFFVRCPNAEQHTGGRHGRTDAYVFIGDSGAFAYHCSHASCQATGKSTWAAFKAGYNIKGHTRTYTAKQRLYIKTDAQHIKTDVLDTIRTLLQDDVLEWLLQVYDAEKPQILIINTGTATGKSHVVMATLENLIMLTPTKELAEEAYNKAVMDLGKNAVLHYSRWHNWTKYRDYLENRNMNRDDIKMSLTDPNGVSCREPDKCETLFQKEHNARNKICEQVCIWRGECKNHGYLSQFRKYQNIKEANLQVYTAHPQNAITDAELQETIEAYGLNREGTVLVIDETDPIRMIPKRQISYEQWREAQRTYRGTYTGRFFECLLRETATVNHRTNAENTEELIKTKNENGLEFRNAIQRAFDAFEQHVSQYNTSLSDALKIVQAQLEEVASWGLDTTPIDNPRIAQLYDGHPAKIDAQIDLLPHNHTRLIRSLQTLLKSTGDSKTPPIRNVSEGTWEFAVPPTLNAKKNIYLTASNTAQLIREQLRDVDAQITQTDTLIAPWQPGNKLYQINTGRYTPRYLFKMEKKIKYKPSGEEIQVDDKATLTTTGQKLIQLVIATLADGKDTLIVAPKAFCEKELWTGESLIQQLHALPNAHITTHQHAIGVNRYSELPRAFIFHYEPHILEFLFACKAIYPNKTLDFTREQGTLENHGVILQEVWRYKAPHVQRIYDAMCANPIMQSENRIRPQLYKNKEIWRLSAEPIPAPITPILFEIPDWQAWIDTERTQTFDAFLQARNNRKIKEIATQDNVSERTAYRKTESPRRENKANRDAEIIRLHKEGHRQSDIAMHVSKLFGKTTQATVSRVIKLYT